VVVVLTVVLALWTALAFAQESLQTAKDLYASAAYDDALGVLSRLRASQPKPEVEQYRILCLVALGRQAEAEEAVDSVVKANPTFVPDAAEISPRIQDLFARTRKQLVPDLARQAYVDAKRAFQRKDREAALAGFDGLVRLIDSADPDSDAELTELRLLASGFLDLSRALPDPAIALKTPALAEPPKPAQAPEIVPPVAIRQVMPQWVPSDNLSRLATFTGAVRVSISASGRVEAAAIDRSVHPAYDPLLLQSARLWEYQPARRDGVPVASEQVVQVQLKPRQ
jgi:tetratricopeptide (TPR) repeat protein